jgi:NADH-quinone oxidoreductase subunit M
MLPILLLIVLVPFAFLLPLVLADRDYSYTLSIIASTIVLLLTAYALYLSYTAGSSVLSTSNFYVPVLNLNFSLRVNQLSMMLLVMTAVVFFASSIVGKYFIGKRDRTYNIIFLLAEGSSLGVFIAANLFFFYVFWEVAEVMMFFIIFLYGGYNRRYASIKFIIYSIFSSLLMLIGILMLYNSVTPHTFNIGGLIASSGQIPAGTQAVILLLFVIAFLIKMPVFPLHSWLPDAHTEAPTTGSMILAGVLLKFGGYGLYLSFLILPVAAHYALYLMLLFIFSTIYSAYVCLSQTNLKRLIAYTSITDMGLVGVGLAAMNAFGYSGSFYAMFNHGVVIAMLFLVAGTLDHVYGTLEIEKIKGVVKNFAGMSYLFILGVFAALGIPLTAGFIADLFIFIGAVGTFGVLGIVPLFGVLVMGAALFWLIERVFMSASKAVEPYNPLGSEVMIASLLLFGAAVLFGVLPVLFLGIH